MLVTVGAQSQLNGIRRDIEDALGSPIAGWGERDSVMAILGDAHQVPVRRTGIVWHVYPNGARLKKYERCQGIEHEVVV